MGVAAGWSRGLGWWRRPAVAFIDAASRTRLRCAERVVPTKHGTTRTTGPSAPPQQPVTVQTCQRTPRRGRWTADADYCRATTSLNRTVSASTAMSSSRCRPEVTTHRSKSLASFTVWRWLRVHRGAAGRSWGGASSSPAKCSATSSTDAGGRTLQRSRRCSFMPSSRLTVARRQSSTQQRPQLRVVGGSDMLETAIDELA